MLMMFYAAYPDENSTGNKAKAVEPENSDGQIIGNAHLIRAQRMAEYSRRSHGNCRERERALRDATTELLRMEVSNGRK